VEKTGSRFKEKETLKTEGLHSGNGKVASGRECFKKFYFSTFFKDKTAFFESLRPTGASSG